jgi:hypothetical protein
MGKTGSMQIKFWSGKLKGRRDFGDKGIDQKIILK